MHIKKNVFKNTFNTIMNIEGKTKDNAKSREDMTLLCRRKKLERNMHTGKYPKVCYTLDKQQKYILCEWVKSLKFSMVVSNMGRCVDIYKYKLFGMKSHDCHMFIQRLLPIAFREFLSNMVWQTLTELSLFFKNFISTNVKIIDIEHLEQDIPITIYKLECIFSLAFFYSIIVLNGVDYAFLKG